MVSSIRRAQQDRPTQGAGPRVLGWKPLAAFVLLAFALSWSWWLPMAFTGQISRARQGWPTHLPGLLGPALAAVLVTAATEGREGLRELGRRTVRWRLPGWCYLVLGGTLALVLLPVVWRWLTDGDLVTHGLTTYSGAPAWPLISLVAYVLVVNGLGEEMGWRGYLTNHLLDGKSRGVTALVVWVVWAVWHLPMFWVVASFRDFGIATALGWLVSLGLGSLVLTWLYDAGGRSVLLVALWHVTFNFATGTEATAGLFAAIASSLVMVAGLLIALSRGTWRRPPGKS